MEMTTTKKKRVLNLTPERRRALAEYGRKGGLSKSNAKILACWQNGEKGRRVAKACRKIDKMIEEVATLFVELVHEEMGKKQKNGGNNGNAE